jgi:diguanylate cyclase (GGDEF)-like protein/PAS domain S-box-containing protein
MVSLALGLLPDAVGAIAHGRKTLCESLTVSCSLAAQRNDRKTIEANLQAVTDRNPDVLSAALRLSNGRLHTVVGEHQKHWSTATERSTLTHMQVPIHIKDSLWGRIELCFATPNEHNWTILPTSALCQMLFVVAASMLGHFVYLRRVLRHLDPSQVIPERVRQTLDSLAEGLLVLDRDERIVLANEAFTQTVGQSADELHGHKVSELPWSGKDGQETRSRQPWEKSIHDGVVETGQVLQYGDDETVQRIFQVNSAPIPGANGESRGALATFSDITALEVRNSQLGETLTKLQQSRDQISDQNAQLKILAMIDPLTQCLNRRAFFEELENQVAAAGRKGHPISYVIMDIDYFKLVNDNHGHQTGDNVLKQVSQLLQTTVDNRGYVCRYGGEEFSILLPEINVAQAAELAEALRKRIESSPIADLKITASFGVVQLDVDNAEPLEALDHADKALYFAKRTGRNRIVRGDQIPTEANFRDGPRTSNKTEETCTKTHIPFTAVSVLISALDCRDSDTAEHSRRVANLCVAMAAGLMSEEHRYVLEVAALLHDMGKLSVPDSILLKPSPLTQEEWKVMDTHLRLGEKTVKNAFASPELVEILRTYRVEFHDNSHDSQISSGDDITLAARILHIADAYDAMVSHHTYRDEMSEDEAFAELRRCAGSQFDPELVERCIHVVVSSEEHWSPPVEGINTDVALRIGSQLERLVFAIDGEDVVSLGIMAERLKAIAEQSGIDTIAELAEDLHQQIDDDAPWTETLQLCSELLDLCRQTQHAYTSSRNMKVS